MAAPILVRNAREPAALELLKLSLLPDHRKARNSCVVVGKKLLSELSAASSSSSSSSSAASSSSVSSGSSSSSTGIQVSPIEHLFIPRKQRRKILNDDTVQNIINSIKGRVLYAENDSFLSKASGLKTFKGDILGTVTIPANGYYDHNNSDSSNKSGLLAAPFPKLILVLRNFTDEGSLGAVLRSALAFQFHGIFLLGKGNADVFSPSAIRASQGAGFSLLFGRGGVEELESFCDQHGLNIVGARSSGIASEDTKSVIDERYFEKKTGVALVLDGAEEDSFSRKIVSHEHVDVNEVAEIFGSSASRSSSDSENIRQSTVRNSGAKQMQSEFEEAEFFERLPKITPFSTTSGFHANLPFLTPPVLAGNLMYKLRAKDFKNVPRTAFMG